MIDFTFGVFFTANSLKFVEIVGHKPTGFEIVFPAMLKEAKILGLDLPYELPFTKQIMEKREAKLKRLNSDHDSPLLVQLWS